MVWIVLLSMMAGLGQVTATATATGEAAGAQTPVKEFQGLEDRWSVALAQRDQFALENLLLPGMVDVSAGAEVSTRNQLIANVLAGQPEPLMQVTQKVVNARVVSDVAIVEGTYVLRLREGDKVRDERGVFTHVWERTRSSWACVSAQRTAVVDQLEGAKPAKAPGEKKPGAGEPFHIPLVLKGGQPKGQQTTPPVTNNPDH